MEHKKCTHTLSVMVGTKRLSICGDDIDKLMESWENNNTILDTDIENGNEYIRVIQ